MTSIDDHADFITVKKALSILGFSDEEAGVRREGGRKREREREYSPFLPCGLYGTLLVPSFTLATLSTRLDQRVTPGSRTPNSSRPSPRYIHVT